MESSLFASVNDQGIDESKNSQTIEPEQEVLNDQNSIQSSVTKPKKTRAIVYEFFEWSEETGQYKCKLCEKKYSIPKSGGTGSLNNHMNRKHKSVFDSEKKVKEDTAAAENGRAVISHIPLKITSEMFRHKLVMFMICTDQPFTLVEDDFFRDFINYCSGGNKDCQLFCAKTAKSIIERLYDEYKANMKKVLENNDGKISFVIDCWTSSNQYPFQGVVARWINNDWELCTTVLDLTILKGSHEGVNIAAAFWNVVKDYNLCEKLLSVTTDNASNMDTMFVELENLALQCGITYDSKNYRVRCFAHIMNLSCQAMIHSVGDGDVTKYSSDSESDDEENVIKAKELPVYAKLRKGVVGIRNSPQRREHFYRQCVAAKIEPKIVLRDVKTRWDSTHAMIERAKELRGPYDLTLRSIPKLRKYVLLDEEWEKIYALMVLLAPFQAATVMLSNEHSPTISRIASVYQELFGHLEKYLKNDSDETGLLPSKRKKRSDIQKYPTWLVEAAKRGFDKLEKYYPSSDGLVYIVGTVLDPRCKLVWYKATGWPKEWIDFSRKCVTELYKSQYKQKCQSDHVEPTNSQNDQENQLFKDLFTKQMKKYQKISTADDELKAYLAENVVDPDLLIKEKTGIDGALGWWKIHQKEYPNLSKMAKDFLPAAGTGVPVERLFSSGGDVVSPRQQSMAAETIQMRVCLKAWLKDKSSFKQDIFKAIAHKFGVLATDEIETVPQIQLR